MIPRPGNRRWPGLGWGINVIQVVQVSVHDCKFQATVNGTFTRNCGRCHGFALQVQDYRPDQGTSTRIAAVLLSRASDDRDVPGLNCRPGPDGQRKNSKTIQDFVQVELFLHLAGRLSALLL